MTTKRVVFMAITSALYCALTVLLNPISFGPLQFRVANLLMVLMFFDIDFCFGIALGVFLGNLTSPFGPLDWVVMPIITFLSSLMAYAMRKHWYVGLVIWALITSAGISFFPLGMVANLPFLSTFPVILVSQLTVGYMGYIVFFPFRKQLSEIRK